MGIRVALMLSIGWGLAAMLSAVSGMMAASQIELTPNFMLILLTYAFAAAVSAGSIARRRRRRRLHHRGRD